MDKYGMDKCCKPQGPMPDKGKVHSRPNPQRGPAEAVIREASKQPPCKVKDAHVKGGYNGNCKY